MDELPFTAFFLANMQTHSLRVMAVQGQLRLGIVSTQEQVDEVDAVMDSYFQVLSNYTKFIVERASRVCEAALLDEHPQDLLFHTYFDLGTAMTVVRTLSAACDVMYEQGQLTDDAAGHYRAIQVLIRCFPNFSREDSTASSENGPRRRRTVEQECKEDAYVDPAIAAMAETASHGFSLRNRFITKS